MLSVEEKLEAYIWVKKVNQIVAKLWVKTQLYSFQCFWDFKWAYFLHNCFLFDISKLLGHILCFQWRFQGHISCLERDSEFSRVYLASRFNLFDFLIFSDKLQKNLAIGDPFNPIIKFNTTICKHHYSYLFYPLYCLYLYTIR